jgi:hypothetical protein
MKISERKINNIVLESIKKVVNEGAYGTEYEDKWNDLETLIGPEKMLNELYHWLDYDVIIDFINDLYEHYDL